MNYYALVYEVADDYVARRTQFREQHLALARAAQGRGEIVLAGALGDPVDGALIVFRATSTALVEEFASNDPYVRNGLVTRWRVRPWAVVVGNDPANAGATGGAW